MREFLRHSKKFIRGFVALFLFEFIIFSPQLQLVLPFW